MRRWAVIVVAVSFSAFAEPPEKARLCVSCHGEKGVSANDLWPNIAGQKKKYLIKQIKEFKAGQREDPLMTAIAKQLSDKEIEELAAYYSQLKVAP